MGDPIVLERLLVAVSLLATATCAVLLARAVVRPLPRLAGRVRPFSLAARASLGRAADAGAIDRALADHGLVRRLLGAVAAPVVARLSERVDVASHEGLERRIRQARVHRHVPGDQRVVEHRLREVGFAVAGGVIGIVGSALAGLSPLAVLALGAAGAVVGGSRPRARLDRAIEQRRDRMRVELYTVNHLVAMHVRVGGGTTQALTRVTRRGNGEIVAELREVLAMTGAGVPIADALVAASRETPEPQVARTYRLLAAASTHGSDLADALLAHSDDVREARREALRRAATRRRAATLLPIIAVLAPVMLLFIAAPLPSIVFGAQ